MIGHFERHCPKCGAGVCRYNAGPFCWPCSPREGFAWHWSEVTHEWVEIPVVEVEKPWMPAPGDLILGETSEPVRHKVDNWDKWRKAPGYGARSAAVGQEAVV